jgi:hypothetical protein
VAAAARVTDGSHIDRRFAEKKEAQIKQPGLDGRQRDEKSPKAGEIRQKRNVVNNVTYYIVHGQCQKAS